MKRVRPDVSGPQMGGVTVRQKALNRRQKCRTPRNKFRVSQPVPGHPRSYRNLLGSVIGVKYRAALLAAPNAIVGGDPGTNPTPTRADGGIDRSAAAARQPSPKSADLGLHHKTKTGEPE
jgi:hypothetical protein